MITEEAVLEDADVMTCVFHFGASGVLQDSGNIVGM